jgi:hypothetical protein
VARAINIGHVSGGAPAARAGNEHLRARITVNVAQYVFMRRPTSEVGNKLSPVLFAAGSAR